MRNKFLQLILISLDSASWELHQYLRQTCGPMKNPKVETRSRESNSGPQDCEANALPHDHGHCRHTETFITSIFTKQKNLDWSKLKAFADDKVNLADKLKLVLGRVENIVGKGKNAGYQHFLLFTQCFQKASLAG